MLSKRTFVGKRVDRKELTITDTAVQTIPQAGVWDVDPAHSSVELVARHLMATKVRGRVGEWAGTLTTGAGPEEATVERA